MHSMQRYCLTWLPTLWTENSRCAIPPASVFVLQVAAKQDKRTAVVDARVLAAQAQERVAAEKRQQAEEERTKQAANAKALMEAQLRDIAEKRDIIMQLRALEKVPRQHIADFDPTEVPDHGLLESMPLVELRERLLVARQREKEEVRVMRVVCWPLPSSPWASTVACMSLFLCSKHCG